MAAAAAVVVDLAAFEKGDLKRSHGFDEERTRSASAATDVASDALATGTAAGCRMQYCGLDGPTKPVNSPKDSYLANLSVRLSPCLPARNQNR